MHIEQVVQDFQNKIQALKKEIGKIIVGHHEVIDQIIICLLAGGHVLLEGVPGIGKTLLIRTLSQCLNLTFSRIQFTPDLMPADITGTNLIVEDGSGKKVFQFQKGPIFGNIILADEINRATPKTQSALLEAMQESGVTVAGTRYNLNEPFMVLATQNPIEMEGTYPLPEAQLDRFCFKILIRSPELSDLNEIITRTTRGRLPKVKPVLDGTEVLNMSELVRQIPIAEHLVEYTSKLVLSSHPDSELAGPMAKKYLRYGASPRAAQAMVLGAKIIAFSKGRLNVSQDDLAFAAYPALRHRLILNFEGEAEGIKPDDIITELIEITPKVPKEVDKLLATK